MTSDKFIYLFGKLIPAMSLILSMVLRFVPKFKNQIEKVSDAQKCIGRDVTNGNTLAKAKYGMKILSIMTTWDIGKFSGDSRFHEVERIWTAWQN